MWPSRRRKVARSVVREARRLVGLIDNVLLFARSGAVRLTPQLKPVAVNALDSFWTHDVLSEPETDYVPMLPRGGDALPGWAG